MVKPSHLELEEKINSLNFEFFEKLSPHEWYDFLLKEYFKWKYTAPNRYATTTRYLKKYISENKINELFDIKNRLLKFESNDIFDALSISREIKGLGVAGASGLISIMYPEYFGTVDQFVVKALCKTTDLQERKKILKINSDSIKIIEGVLLIEIMQKKAKELNTKFATDFWTPRKIDMVLWGAR